MNINDQDKNWLHSNQPTLEISQSKDGKLLIIGVLRIVGVYDEVAKEYIFGNGDDLAGLPNFFDETFAIRIEGHDGNLLPKVKEVGGKFESLQKKLQKSHPDMHFDQFGYACIVGPLDNFLYRKNEKSLSDFIRELVQPFFYDQLYHAKFGTWPRGEYLHFFPGVIENFGKLNQKEKEECSDLILELIEKSNEVDIKKLLTKRGRIKGHMPCLCASKKPIRKCHNQLFLGLWYVKEFLIN